MDNYYTTYIEIIIFRLNCLLTAGYYFCANLMEYVYVSKSYMHINGIFFQGIGSQFGTL